MATPKRPFRFAAQAFATESAASWQETARRVEALGYSALHVADHYIGPGPALDATNHTVQTVAAIPAMAVAAEATTTLRVGGRVLCVDYHQPVVLAKELATLDLLSDGRIEAGLGAGWLGGEYDAMGIPFQPAGARLERLDAVVDLLRACFGEGQVKVDQGGVLAQGFEAVPKPVQPGGPPIMIGGGSPQVLRLAGAKADIVSLNFDNSSGRLGTEGVASGGAEQTRAKVAWVREGAGDRFGEIELEIAAYFTAVTDRIGDVAARLCTTLGVSPSHLGASPHVLLGPVGAICERLEERREAYGISYVTVGQSVAEDFAPVVARLAGT